MYFFTGDEHFFHKKIILYSKRPFKDEDEMRSVSIEKHNSVVKKNDIVIHVGDFAFLKKLSQVMEFVSRNLNGSHIFLRGSHDKWMNSNFHEIWTKQIGKYYFVACHYSMLTWPRSHYNSFLLFGHSHGRINDKVKDIGKCYDVGVDNNDFYPISEEQIIKIMETKPGIW